MKARCVGTSSDKYCIVVTTSGLVSNSTILLAVVGGGTCVPYVTSRVFVVLRPSGLWCICLSRNMLVAFSRNGSQQLVG